jgi:hypothetical protein
MTVEWITSGTALLSATMVFAGHRRSVRNRFDGIEERGTPMKLCGAALLAATLAVAFAWHLIRH